jgi:hypothetical protein
MVPLSVHLFKLTEWAQTSPSNSYEELLDEIGRQQEVRRAIERDYEEFVSDA